MENLHTEAYLRLLSISRLQCHSCKQVLDSRMFCLHRMHTSCSRQAHLASSRTHILSLLLPNSPQPDPLAIAEV